MFIERFNKYSSMYVDMAKTILFRTHHITPSKITQNMLLEPVRENYDLHFNKNGVLLQSNHYNRFRETKIIYGYDDYGVLNNAMEILPRINRIESISEFLYDSNFKICKELYRWKDVLIERTHNYLNEMEVIREFHSNYKVEFFYYKTFDKNHKLIEFITKMEPNETDVEASAFKERYKYEYDSVGNLNKETSFDLEGIARELTNYTYFENGCIKTSNEVSDERNINRSFEYLFNPKEHWIRKTEFNNSNPFYYYERNIEYY